VAIQPTVGELGNRQRPVDSLASGAAAAICEAFTIYHEEFNRISRLARARFEQHDWKGAQQDALERLDLRSRILTEVVGHLRELLAESASDRAVWSGMKAAFSELITRRSDWQLAESFFNSVTRDLFGTVGVNPEVEFCATSVGRASGAVPIRVYRVGGSLPTAVREILTDLPFGAAIGAAAGAGAGTAGAAVTGKKDIEFPAETRLAFTTRTAVTIN